MAEAKSSPDLDALSSDELRSRTLRGLRWSVLARPISEIATLGSMVVLARLVSPAEFGRFAVAAIVVDLASIPTAGVGGALVQRSSVDREHLEAGFALALLAGLILVGLTWIVAGVAVGPIFGARTATLVRMATPLCLVLAVSTVPSSQLQRQLRFKRLSIIDVTNAVVRAAASIVLVVAGMKGLGLVLGALAGGLASTALVWFWAPPPIPRLRREPVMDILGYGSAAALAAVSWVGFRNCDYAIVGARLGAMRAGFYFRAYTLAVEYQKKVSQLMMTVGFPVLSRTQTRDELHSLRSQMVRQLALVLFPMLVLLAIVAPTFVPWVLGPAWQPAITPTQILALGGAATVVIDTAGAALMASGRARALVAFGWGHFLAYAVAVFLVAPLGLTAVAVSAAAVHSAFLVLAYVLMLHGSERRLLASLWQDLGAPLSCSAALATAAIPASMALSAAHASAPVYLAGVLCLGAIAYLVGLRAAFPAAWRQLWALAGHVLPPIPLRRLIRRPPVVGAGASR